MFNRGYIDYDRFDEYCEKGIRFASRLKENAIIEILEEHFVEEGSPIEDDLAAILNKGCARMKHRVRVVTTQDSQGNPITIVTNLFNVTAEEISDIYRNRWRIELFFKWLKKHTQIKHFYDMSMTAITNQIFICLLTYCALTLLRLKCGYKGQLLQIQRLLMTCRFETFTSFVRKLYGKERSSQGRRQLRHDEIYRFTEDQIMAGNIELLIDTTYDRQYSKIIYLVKCGIGLP